MDSQPDHDATPNKKVYRSSWLREHKAKLKWAGLVVLLLLLAGALPPLLSAYNVTGRCLSRLSTLSESEMKLRVVKSIVAYHISGDGTPVGSQTYRKIMFLGRSVTPQELIQRNQSGTLLGLLDERPLLLRNEDQLNQFSSKIDAGEFTILDYYSSTTYELSLLLGKSLNRADPTTTSEFFKKYKDFLKADEKFNHIGNYLYKNDYYRLDATCCNAKLGIDKEEKIDAKKRNLEGIHFWKKNQHHFVVSNCGSVWIDPDDRYSF